MVLASALLADSVNLEGMAGGQVVIFAPDLLLEVADLGREELDRTAARGTDHVVMTAAIVLVFVAGDAVMKRDFARQAAFGEEFECSVHSGVADPGVTFLD